jgi:hypothetical protein
VQKGSPRAGSVLVVALAEHLAEVGVHGGGLLLVEQLARPHELEELLGVRERLTTEKGEDKQNEAWARGEAYPKR